MQARTGLEPMTLGYRCSALIIIQIRNLPVESDYMKLFNNFLQRASDICSYNGRYPAAQTLHKPRISPNIGKQTIFLQAIDLWRELQTHFKDLSVLAFSKAIKHYLLSDRFCFFPSQTLHCKFFFHLSCPKITHNQAGGQVEKRRTVHLASSLIKIRLHQLPHLKHNSFIK